VKYRKQSLFSSGNFLTISFFVFVPDFVFNPVTPPARPDEMRHFVTKK
jgi:hypothetical protein